MLFIHNFIIYFLIMRKLSADNINFLSPYEIFLNHTVFEYCDNDDEWFFPEDCFSLFVSNTEIPNIKKMVHNSASFPFSYFKMSINTSNKSSTDTNEYFVFEFESHEMKKLCINLNNKKNNFNYCATTKPYSFSRMFIFDTDLVFSFYQPYQMICLDCIVDLNIKVYKTKFGSLLEKNDLDGATALNRTFYA